MSRYLVPAAPHRVTQELRRSRFLTALAPAPDVATAEAFLAAMRAEFPDANHHCYAYLIGPPGRTDRVSASDDGEPRGTAGRPMLQVLVHSGIGDIAAVVVRHFGGVKLGTGGLTRAYSGGVRLALEGLPTQERVARATARLRLSYPDLEQVKRLLPEHDTLITQEDFGVAITLTLAPPEDQLDALEAALTSLTLGRAHLEPER